MIKRKKLDIPDVVLRRYESYLPTAFDESLTLVEKMNKMVVFFNKLIEGYNELSSELGNIGMTLNELKREVAYISKEIEKVRNGDYVSLYLESIENWIDRNLIKLVSDIAKIVWFGLNDEGYFVAYIPDSWDHIQFNTSNDGNLILEY